MKQFNLNEYLANPSKKVVTRDGHPVRIICTDHDNVLYPIVGTIKGYDFPFCFDKDGQPYGYEEKNPLDLFFATEKKKGWVNIFKGTDGNNYIGTHSRIYESKEDAEEAGRGCSDYITIKIEWGE